MTDTSLSDRLRARADYLGTIMSGDPPVQLDAESPLLLRAAANTIDYLAPFQAALRLLGFGDEHCASADPVDYAKRWLAERLREDTARAEAERRLEETMTELNRVCGLSVKDIAAAFREELDRRGLGESPEEQHRRMFPFARISLAEAPRREEVEARLRRASIEPDADLTGSVTLLLDKLEAAQHTNASLDLALRKRQATVDRQGNELGVLRTERKVCSSLGIELNNTLAIDDAVVATVAHRELAWRLQQAELKVRSHELNCPRPGASIKVSPKSDPAMLAALGLSQPSPPPNIFQEAAEKLGRELARRVDAMLAGLGPGQRLAVGEVVFPGGLGSEVAMRVLDPGEAPPLGQRWTVYGPVTPELAAKVADPATAAPQGRELVDITITGRSPGEEDRTVVVQGWRSGDHYTIKAKDLPPWVAAWNLGVEVTVNRHRVVGYRYDKTSRLTALTTEDRAKVLGVVWPPADEPVESGPWDCPKCGQRNGPVTDDCKGFTCTGCGHMYSVGT